MQISIDRLGSIGPDRLEDRAIAKPRVFRPNDLRDTRSDDLALQHGGKICHALDARPARTRDTMLAPAEDRLALDVKEHGELRFAYVEDATNPIEQVASRFIKGRHRLSLSEPAGPCEFPARRKTLGFSQDGKDPQSVAREPSLDRKGPAALRHAASRLLR